MNLDKIKKYVDAYQLKNTNINLLNADVTDTGVIFEISYDDLKIRPLINAYMSTGNWYASELDADVEFEELEHYKPVILNEEDPEKLWVNKLDWPTEAQLQQQHEREQFYVAVERVFGLSVEALENHRYSYQMDVIVDKCNDLLMIEVSELKQEFREFKEGLLKLIDEEN